MVIIIDHENFGKLVQTRVGICQPTLDQATGQNGAVYIENAMETAHARCVQGILTELNSPRVVG